MKKEKIAHYQQSKHDSRAKAFDFVLIIICLVFGLRFVYGAYIVLVQEQSSHKLIGVGNLFLSS